MNRAQFVLLLLLAFGARSAAQEPEPDSGRGEGIPSAAAAILARSPNEWPLADPERWKDWTPDAPVPDELSPPVAAIRAAYARGDLPATLDAIFRALELEPGYPPALHQAGVVYFRLRRYGDAAVAFERYLRVQPKRVGDTRALGHCYYTLGRYEEARDHYELVLEAEPESVEALRGLALAHMRLGDVERALELLRRVVELDPKHANAWAWIGQILFDEERGDEALGAAERARELDPFAPRPWFLLSRIEFDRGEDERGEADYARYELLARIDQETRALEARLRYDPRQRELYARLVELHRTAGNDAAEKEALLRWLMVEPRDVALRIRVLDLLVEMRDATSAAQAARALAQVGAEDPDAWARLAVYYAGTRERIRQVEAERRCAELRARRAK